MGQVKFINQIENDKELVRFLDYLNSLKLDYKQIDPDFQNAILTQGKINTLYCICFLKVCSLLPYKKIIEELGMTEKTFKYLYNLLRKAFKLMNNLGVMYTGTMFTNNPNLTDEEGAKLATGYFQNGFNLIEKLYGKNS